jgi:hypothetical protein
MMNIQRHDRCSSSNSAKDRADAGASIAGIDTTAIVRAIRSGPACRASIVWPAGMSRPPPTPCSARKAMRLPADQAAPHSAEPAMNRTGVIQIRLREALNLPSR